MYRRPANAADVRWYVYDGLGSVVGEVDVNGNVTGSKKHDVYGLTRSTSGSPQSKHGWVGQLGHTSDEETGLVYMRARHYDPVTGRFNSQDPAGDGNNWFAYCGNDPVNNVDPTGTISADLANFWQYIFNFLRENATKYGADVLADALRFEADKMSTAGDKYRQEGLAQIAAGENLKVRGLAAGTAGDILKSAGEQLIKEGGSNVAKAAVLKITAGQVRVLAEMVEGKGVMQ